MPLTPVVPAYAAVFDGIAQDELTLGEPRRAVTINIYTNFICGHCATFALEILPPLVTEYAADGRVRFIFQHAPLGGAPPSARTKRRSAPPIRAVRPAFAEIYANFSQQAAAYADDRLSAMMANAGLDVAAFDGASRRRSSR